MFTLNGQKWGPSDGGTPSGPVYWSPGNFVEDLDFNRSVYTEQEFIETLASAFQAWEDVSGIDFELANAANPADITFAAAPLSGNTVGLASYSFINRGGEFAELTSAEITFDDPRTWSPDGNGGTDFYAVALHEIGHAIGLGHVNDESEILNPTISTDELGDGDIEGAQALYGPAAGSEPTPPPPPPADPAPEPEPEADPEPEAAPEAEPIAEDDGGGGAGGVLALVGLGALVAILGSLGGLAGGALAGLGLLSGGGGGGAAIGAAVALGRVDETEPEDEDEASDDAVTMFSTFGCPSCGGAGCSSCAPDFEGDTSEPVLEIFTSSSAGCPSCGGAGCSTCTPEQFEQYVGSEVPVTEIVLPEVAEPEAMVPEIAAPETSILALANPVEEIAGFPIVAFDESSQGCPFCGDSACSSCGQQEDGTGESFMA